MNSSVSEAKKTILGCRYGLPDFIFLFLFELSTCVQNLIFTKVVEGCQKIIFRKGVCQNSRTKTFFLTIKIAYEKFLDWKSKWRKHALMPPLQVEIFIFEKH
jgi:hypothetical protein